VVAEVQAAWGGTRAEKQAAYEALVAAIAELARAVAVLAQVHERQDRLVHRMPRAIWERLSFPDTAAFLNNLAARLPRGWGAATLAIQPLTQGELNQVVDVDQGLRDLPERALARFLAEHRG
jgi:hypothetical protein